MSRLFLDELRRRLLSLVDDLSLFEQRHHRRAPAWTYQDVALAGETISAAEEVSAAPSSADLDDAMSALEVRIRNMLADLVGLDELDRPIPYEPVPWPSPQRLTLLRGGRA